MSLLVLAAVALAGCDGSSGGGNVPEQAPQGSRNPIEGYGDLKFGSTLMEAVGQVGSERFNSYGLKLCLDDLPLKGCFLSPATDAAPYLIEGGIPYKLGLDFNKFDKLTDIRLSYDREGNTSFDECLSLHERTLDWLTKQYGKMVAHMNPKETLESRKTPSGVPYLLGRTKDGNFVTGFVRTAPERLPLNVRRKPIKQWDTERYVHLLSHYIVVDGEPNCHVGIGFSEPEFVERRPPMDQTSYTMPEQAEPTAGEDASGAMDEDYVKEPSADENGGLLNAADQTSAPDDI